jgi:NAD(P)-dependent dehydrogenase (short-subunit alcohol dehydrogenase family)
MELQGAIAVVTGTSAGLGRQFAVDLARAGAVVTGVARRPALLADLAVELTRSSPGSTTEVCDVSDTDRFTALLHRIEERHGRIDLLVNNAGIGEPVEGPDELARHRLVMATNYFAPVAGTFAVLPGMISRRHGVVVNVSSDSGRAPGPGDVAYAPSKAALTAFTESLSYETEGSGVSLHVLYPGWVPTAMGTGAVERGMATPPRAVRRSPEQVSRLLLARLGGPRVDIDATRVARIAPVARALVPGLYRKGMRRSGG